MMQFNKPDDVIRITKDQIRLFIEGTGNVRRDYGILLVGRFCYQ
jgi:hypothetical protein